MTETELKFLIDDPAAGRLRAAPRRWPGGRHRPGRDV
jgi:hypothetical protein